VTVKTFTTYIQNAHLRCYLLIKLVRC